MIKHEWINTDKQEITNEVIVNVVNNVNESCDNRYDNDDNNHIENRQMKISHTDGLKTIDSAIECRTCRRSDTKIPVIL